MSNVIDENIVVVDYKAEWRQLFEKEKLEIEFAINEPKIWIEHIGSTAVEGLTAKPIVDIQLGIKDWTHLEKVKPALIGIGYEYFGEAGVPGRYYFRKRGDDAFSVHVVLFESTLWTNNILIRDYLKNNLAIAIEYSEIKLSAIENGFNTLLAYSEHKNKFISELLIKANNRK